MTPFGSRLRVVRALIIACALITGCSDSGGGGSSPTPTPTPPPAPPPAPPPPPPPPPATQADSAFETQASTVRFLTQATFGPTETDVSQLTGTSGSAWFVNELSKTPSLVLPEIGRYRALDDPDAEVGELVRNAPSFAFWINTISGDDQLRQRMAFALSQIFVVSNVGENALFVAAPEALASFQDVLIENAFGNYRDLLEAVTYSPAMAFWLTYLQNQKADPLTGQVPDENYAREIMQLFSLGVIALQANGEPALNGSGETVEIYDNDDITGLAKVFTGLSLDDTPGDFFSDFEPDDRDAYSRPLATFPEFHSEEAKTFLGFTIPANTGPVASIDQALDHIFSQANVPPFVGRQLIQRFVTSDPSPAYVARVSAAFEAGAFTLPNNEVVGDGIRGDLSATLAAVLFDPEARDAAAALANDTFGKVREPIIRFTHWARFFEADSITPEFTLTLWNTEPPAVLGQHPYRAPSVFNFYRPGYIAPGTATGTAGLTVPELQITNSATVGGYANFLTFFTLSLVGPDNVDDLEEVFTDTEVPLDPSNALTSFLPDLSDEIALAGDPAALLDRLDLLLTYGSMSAETRAQIIETLNTIPLSDPTDPSYDGATFRAQLAVVMAMTSPDYVVQR